MSKCQECGQEMTDSKTERCFFSFVSINGTFYERNTEYFDTNERCHDCNIVNKEGNTHHFGCDMERCPICGNQLISCGCLDNKSVKLSFSGVAEE